MASYAAPDAFFANRKTQLARPRPASLAVGTPGEPQPDDVSALLNEADARRHHQQRNYEHAFSPPDSGLIDRALDVYWSQPRHKLSRRQVITRIKAHHTIDKVVARVRRRGQLHWTSGELVAAVEQAGLQRRMTFICVRAMRDLGLVSGGRGELAFVSLAARLTGDGCPLFQRKARTPEQIAARRRAWRHQKRRQRGRIRCALGADIVHSVHEASLKSPQICRKTRLSGCPPARTSKTYAAALARPADVAAGTPELVPIVWTEVAPGAEEQPARHSSPERQVAGVSDRPEALGEAAQTASSASNLLEKKATAFCVGAASATAKVAVADSQAPAACDAIATNVPKAGAFSKCAYRLEKTADSPSGTSATEPCAKADTLHQAPDACDGIATNVPKAGAFSNNLKSLRKAHEDSGAPSAQAPSAPAPQPKSLYREDPSAQDDPSETVPYSEPSAAAVEAERRAADKPALGGRAVQLALWKLRAARALQLLKAWKHEAEAGCGHCQQPPKWMAQRLKRGSLAQDFILKTHVADAEDIRGCLSHFQLDGRASLANAAQIACSNKALWAAAYKMDRLGASTLHNPVGFLLNKARCLTDKAHALAFPPLSRNQFHAQLPTCQRPGCPAYRSGDPPKPRPSDSPPSRSADQGALSMSTDLPMPPNDAVRALTDTPDPGPRPLGPPKPLRLDDPARNTDEAKLPPLPLDIFDRHTLDTVPGLRAGDHARFVERNVTEDELVDAVWAITDYRVRRKVHYPATWMLSYIRHARRQGR